MVGEEEGDLQIGVDPLARNSVSMVLTSAYWSAAFCPSPCV